MIKHKIALVGLEFFAFHGVHPSENEKGNRFTVDVEIETDFTKAALSDELSGTINYEQVYDIVEKEMSIKSKLLEHVASRILLKLQQLQAVCFAIKVTVSKLDPPLKGKAVRSTAEINYKRK